MAVVPASMEFASRVSTRTRATVFLALKVALAPPTLKRYYKGYLREGEREKVEGVRNKLIEEGERNKGKKKKKKQTDGGRKKQTEKNNSCERKIGEENSTIFMIIF